jgi:transcriptional regulator
MYVPRHYREERRDVLAAAVRDIQLAALVTQGPDGLQVSHVPMFLTLEANGDWTLATHVARGNPHWGLTGVATVAIFQGPQAYISPSYYASKREHGKVVPTWNYIAVHAHGTLERVEDAADLRTILEHLTDRNEGARAQPWAMSDAPDDYLAGMMKAIVGMRLRVARIEGAWKMNQHRPRADRVGMINGLQADARAEDVVSVLNALEAARSDG